MSKLITVKQKWEPFNKQIFSSPWICKIISWSNFNILPEVIWGRFVGTHENGGYVYISAEEGEVIKTGQKNKVKGFSEDTLYYKVIKENTLDGQNIIKINNGSYKEAIGYYEDTIYGDDDLFFPIIKKSKSSKRILPEEKYIITPEDKPSFPVPPFFNIPITLPTNKLMKQISEKYEKKKYDFLPEKEEVFFQKLVEPSIKKNENILDETMSYFKKLIIIAEKFLAQASIYNVADYLLIQKDITTAKKIVLRLNIMKRAKNFNEVFKEVKEAKEVNKEKKLIRAIEI